MKNFITPVSMQVTEEQFEKDLRQPLLDLWYKLSVVDFFDRVLVNDYGENEINDLMYGNREYHDRYFIGKYNPTLFLALCAMTEGDTPIVGEYMICLKNVDDSGTWKSSKGEIIKVVSISDCGDPMQKGSFGKRFSEEHYRKATKEELINHFTKENTTKETMKTFKVTRQNLKNIYDVACQDWKTRIDKLTTEYLGNFKESGELPESLVREMFGAANDNQKKTLKHVFPEFETEFTAKDLKVGEMMVVEGKQINQEFNGETLLRTFEGIVSLSDPKKTWTSNCPLKGRKLKSGESITIKQP